MNPVLHDVIMVFFGSMFTILAIGIYERWKK
jgi:hypothetical protein